jgi:hypothetical protein
MKNYLRFLFVLSLLLYGAIPLLADATIDGVDMGNAHGGAGVSVTVAIDCHANCSPTAAQLTSGAVLYNTGQTTGNSAVTLPAVSGWSTGSFSLDVTATTTGMPVGNITVSSTTANICLDEACGTTYTTLTVTTPTADTSLVCRAFGNGADIHCYSVGAMSATGS